MFTHRKRKAFTVWELVVVILVIVALMALLLPAIRQSNGHSRRNVCTNKMHQIGIALQNHHDSYKRFPGLSTEPFPQMPGGPKTGFSWITRILPFMEETNLYKNISDASGQFARIEDGGRAAFDPAIRDAAGLRHYATIELDSLICPSFSGEPISDLTTGIYAGTLGIDPKANPPIGIGISTYVAIAATDIARMRGDGSAANGVLVPNQGLNMRAIKDGTSKTIIACETRERALNAWIDGSVNWVVGANPNSLPPVRDEKGYLTMPKGSGTALNVGPGKPSAATRYLTKSISPNGYEWAWGPSSEHSGGVVMHVYADAAVRGQTDDIDPTVYLWLITPADNEPVVDPAVNAG